MGNIELQEKPCVTSEEFHTAYTLPNMFRMLENFAESFFGYFDSKFDSFFTIFIQSSINNIEMIIGQKF